MALSMSNEEKILMRQYGQSYEQVINPSKKALKQSAQMLQARQRSQANLGGAHNASMYYDRSSKFAGDLATPGRMVDRETKLAAILENKEQLQMEAAKKLKDQQVAALKLEKSKAKKEKERQELVNYKIQKKHEKWEAAKNKQLLNLKDQNIKLHELEQKQKQKTVQAAINKEEALKRFTEDKNKIQDPDYSYEGESITMEKTVTSQKKGNRAQTLQSNKHVKQQLRQIEEKLQRATDYRNSIINGQGERLSFYKDKVNIIHSNKAELAEKKEYNVLSQVILKHVEKDKAIKKKAREEAQNKVFLDEKKAQSQMDVQRKLKEIKYSMDEKNQKLRQKFEAIDNKASNYDHSLVDFMTAKREQNEYKQAYHKQNLNRVRRVQSAYKRHLVEKLVN